MNDSWVAGDSYDFFMGRWSKLVAELFVDWLSPQPDLRWLDVGCGSGALSETVIHKSTPNILTAIDQSEGFVATAQQRLGSKAVCRVGNAVSLPLDDSTVDVAVSGLVLNFIPKPEDALAEMKRVTTSGGTVAVYVWDYAGTMGFLNYFWDAALELNPEAGNLHEGRRFPESNAQHISALFQGVGFNGIESAALDISTNFSNFEDFWNPFLGGQGPAPTYVSRLQDSERHELKRELMDRLPIEKDGSISLIARAWSVRGCV